MKINMGALDRTIRFILSIIAAVLVFTGILNGVAAVVVMAVAVIFFLTSIAGYCPIYSIFKITTFKKLITKKPSSE